MRKLGGLGLAALCLTLATEAQSPSRRPGFSIQITEPANQTVVVGGVSADLSEAPAACRD